MAPIKRHPALQALSRDHHHTLLLVWKIRNGLKKGVAAERMMKYADWFRQNHLVAHFDTEEKLLTGIMPPENELLQQMFAEHKVILALFKEPASNTLLEELALALEQHVRFEERSLFNALQETATEAQLQAFAAHDDQHVFVENTEDTFWL